MEFRVDSRSKLIVPNHLFVYFKLRDFQKNMELVGIQTGKTATVNLPIDFTVVSQKMCKAESYSENFEPSQAQEKFGNNFLVM